MSIFNQLNINFIEPGYEIATMPCAHKHWDVLKHLERIGRVCYKSEDKITEESCIKFLDNIKKRRHWAMLEHFTFVMEVSERVYSELVYDIPTKVVQDIDYNQKRRFINVSKYKDSKGNTRALVSGSATAFNYLWECKCFSDNDSKDAIPFLCKFLNSLYPEIMRNPWAINNFTDEKLLSTRMTALLLSREEIEALPTEQRLIHDTMSVKFLTNIGIAIDMCRHRPVSIAMESTRYVNYGNKGYQYIVPEWVSDHDREILEDHDKLSKIIDLPIGTMDKALRQQDDPFDDTAVLEWLYNQMIASLRYQRCLDKGWVAQQAKDNLPKAYKTELYITANYYEWIHFFNMRADTAPHPDMKKLTYPLLKECCNKEPDIFKNIKWRIETEEGMKYANKLNTVN